ncbi:MAG: ArnT family glycosyltransferase [Anaerolineae bacterium]
MDSRFRGNDSVRDQTSLVNSPSFWLWAILALSVAVRVGVALYLGDIVDAPPLLTDQRSYHALGARLISGHGFSFERAWYPFTPADRPTAHWSFLYSLFVAGIYALFGVHPLAVRLIQGVLGGLLLPWMVYRLARRIWGHCDLPVVRAPAKLCAQDALPLIAAACAAFYLYFVLYAATLMTETFYLVVLLWSLEIGLGMAHRLQAGEDVPLKQGLWLGVSLGLATLLRQSVLPWVPVMGLYLLWLAWRGRRMRATVRALLLAGALLAVFILPFTVRNAVVYGDFLLLNSNTGYAMYSAQHPMHGTHFREFDAAPMPQDMAWGNEAQMDRELMRRGLQFIVDDPVRYLRLSLSRLRAFFEFWPTPDTTLLHNLGRTGSFGLFLPFMAYGLYRVLRDRALRARCALLLLFCGFYTLLHVLTWAMVRYRLPVDAVLWPLAALGVRDLVVWGWRVIWRDRAVTE